MCVYYFLLSIPLLVRQQQSILAFAAAEKVKHFGKTQKKFLQKK
jgi:hypothetical protein